MPTSIRGAHETGLEALQPVDPHADTDAIGRETHLVQTSVWHTTVDHFPTSTQVHASVDITTSPGHQSYSGATEIHGEPFATIPSGFRPRIPAVRVADSAASRAAREEHITLHREVLHAVRGRGALHHPRVVAVICADDQAYAAHAYTMLRIEEVHVANVHQFVCR